MGTRDKLSISKMVQRITYRRRLSYNTKSNKRQTVRTPGGKLVFQYLKKRPSVPKCPMTGMKLKGVKPATNQEKARMSKRLKTVYRAYGGVPVTRLSGRRSSGPSSSRS